MCSNVITTYLQSTHDHGRTVIAISLHTKCNFPHLVIFLSFYSCVLISSLFCALSIVIDNHQYNYHLIPLFPLFISFFFRYGFPSPPLCPSLLQLSISVHLSMIVNLIFVKCPLFFNFCHLLISPEFSYNIYCL